MAVRGTLLIKQMEGRKAAEDVGEALQALPEVQQVDVDLMQKVARVDVAHENLPGREALLEAIEGRGYTVDRIEFTSL